MLTDSDVASALGKRHHSSDEETPIPAGSGHNIHPRNRRKVDDGKQTMDADLEAEHASSLTTAPSGSTPFYPSITSTTPSEISENVKLPIESPCAIVPLAVPVEDPLLQLDQLDKHPGTADDRSTNSTGDRVKIESEEPMISHPNSAWDLYEKLSENLPPDHSNAVRAWFHALSLPYWPERVKIVRGSENDQTGLDDTESVSGLPSSNMANAGGGVSDATDGKVKEEYYTACKLNQATLTKYCNWQFTHATPPESMSLTSAKNTYAEEYQCPKNDAARFIHNIEDRPKRGLDAAGDPEPINRLIVNHLLKEVVRMNANTRFVVPVEWKDKPETPPLSYNPPKDDPYVSYLPQTKKWMTRVPVEQDLYTIVKEESPPMEAFSPPSQEEEESSESRVARKEIEDLCEVHIIDPTAHRDKNESVAIEFYKKFNMMNLPFNKLQARMDAVRDLRGIGGETPCFRMKSRKYIKENNLIQCFGDVTDNEETDSIHEYPPTIITEFLVYESTMEPVPSEGKIESTVGNLLQPIVAGKGILGFRNRALVFPPSLRPVGSNPMPDLYVRALAEFGWPKSLEALSPMVFAGEGKRNSTVDVENIRAQLATAFHATLIILILYYLDTRKELTSDLPPWLFLYGIEYTEFGVNICAHFPSYECDGGLGRWCLESKIITQNYGKIFLTSDKPQRMRFLSNLYRIRSHSVFVLRQLRDWSRAEQVLGVLLKSA